MKHWQDRQTKRTYGLLCDYREDECRYKACVPVAVSDTPTMPSAKRTPTIRQVYGIFT